jgi:hypothetical protein
VVLEAVAPVTKTLALVAACDFNSQRGRLDTAPSVATSRRVASIGFRVTPSVRY